MNSENVKYLVFDIESVPDSKLIRLVKYPDMNYSAEEAVEKFREELLADSEGRTEFIPVTFQYPVSIAIAKVDEAFHITDILCLDDPQFRSMEMTRLFWSGIEGIYNDASMVTFNGRGFDLPLMELMAYRYGIKAKRHFRDKFAGRYRFGTKHIDLQDWLSNYNAIRMNGGLNLCAKLIGKPGKMSTRGDVVYPMFLEGRLEEINNYCMFDVLDTYFVFLRTRVMSGELDIEEEQNIVRKAKKFIEDRNHESGAFQEYLDNWGDWMPWP